MAGPHSSIIIRCYNEADHIGKLLHGLAEQSIQDYEIILVDSGSTDGTVEIAEEFGVDDIVYIDPEDFSFGRALNQGCNRASGKFCVVASAHVYPKRNDWLEQLLKKFEENVALVYGKQRGNDITTFSENQIFKQWFPAHDIERQSHPFCNNANAAIRKKVWEDYAYDEQLTGLEDVDWAKRIQKHGYDISYAAEAEIIHVHDETPSEIFNRFRREAYAYQKILPNQSFSFYDFIRLSLTNIASDYRNAIGEGKLRNSFVEIPKFRFLQFWGTYRGFTKDGPIPDRLWQRFYYPDRESYPSSSNDGTADDSDRPNVDDFNSANYIDYSDLTTYSINQEDDPEADAPS